MSDTKLVSLRIPEDVLLIVDQAAEADNRSRAQIIIMTLQEKFLMDSDLLRPKKQRVSRGSPLNANEVVQKPLEPMNDSDKPAIMDVLRLVPEVTRASELDQRYVRSAHNPATCRLYGCLMCKAAKEEN